MKYLLSSIVLLTVLSCGQSPKEGGGVAKNQSYLTFKYSEKATTMSIQDPGNWCAASFGEAALISADPNNFHRRLFALSNIPLKVVVDLGHQAAGFMLYKTGDHVEIFTSDNLPACLSNKKNFQLSPEGTSFRYDNKMDVQFDVYLQELPNGVQIALDLPPNGGHGLAVVRCESCK